LTVSHRHLCFFSHLSSFSPIGWLLGCPPSYVRESCPVPMEHWDLPSSVGWHNRFYGSIATLSVLSIVDLSVFGCPF
jgi:hypothetical protein